MMGVHENHWKDCAKYTAIQKPSLDSVAQYYWSKAQDSVFKCITSILNAYFWLGVTGMLSKHLANIIDDLVAVSVAEVLSKMIFLHIARLCREILPMLKIRVTFGCKNDSIPSL